MPFTGCGALSLFDRLEKAICESRLSYLYLCACCAWIVLECSLNVKLRINWISIVVSIGTTFANPVTFYCTQEVLHVISRVYNIYTEESILLSNKISKCIA